MPRRVTLTSPQVEQLAREGEELVRAFRCIIESLPDESRGIGAMSRYLQIHKGTCQRVVEGATGSRDGLHAYARFPGVRALRAFLAAARARGVPEAALAGATIAVDQLEGAMTRLDVSKHTLLDLIAGATDAPPSPLEHDRSRAERRSLFSAARRVTGEHVQSKIVIGLFMPSDSAPGRLRTLVISSLRGVLRESYARPISLFILTDPLAKPDNARPLHELVPQFSSTGLRVTPLAGASARSLLAIDTELARPGSSIDATVLFETHAPLDPRVHAGARLVAGARITNPTRLLVHDFYLHRDLDAESPARAGCFSLAAPSGDAPEGGFDECWYERFPERTDCVPLPHPRPDPASRLADDMGAFMLDRAGLPRSAFRAWRCRVDYPLWNSEYRIYVGHPTASEDRTPAASNHAAGALQAT